MAGRELPPTSRFAADDGAADPELAEALARRVAGQGTLADVVAALASARVLVPVLAVEHDDADAAGEPDDAHRSPAGDRCTPAAAEPFAEARHASAGVVAVAAPDGRTALPVFSSVAALTAWHRSARPMPAEGPRAAAAALGEGWDLLVVDPGGAATAVVPRPAVHALAAGRAWVPAVRDGVVAAGVREAVRRVGTVPGVLDADAAPGRGAEVAVVLTLEPGLTRAALERVLADVGAHLAADAEVTAAVDSIELRPVTGALSAAPPEPGLSDAGGAVPARARGWRGRRAPGRRRPRG